VRCTLLVLGPAVVLSSARLVLNLQERPPEKNAAHMRLTKLLTVGQVSRKPLSSRCSISDAEADDGLHRKHQNVVADMQLDERYSLPEDKVALGDLLGKGAFAKVYKCDLDGRAAVCKCIGTGKLDRENIYLLHNECTIWSRLEHTHIVNFFGMTSTSTGLWLLCEYMPGGSLSEVHERKRSANAPRATEGDVLDALQQVASGMMYLHGLEPPVLHRDLKSPNILISGSRLAIADFGLARYQQTDAKMTAETGSYRWMAPEVIRHEQYDCGCDVYSYAILGWELLTYCVPFDDMTPVQAAFAVAKDGKRPPLPSDTPETVQRLLNACWAQDARRRPSFAHVYTALEEETKATSTDEEAFNDSFKSVEAP